MIPRGTSYSLEDHDFPTIQDFGRIEWILWDDGIDYNEVTQPGMTDSLWHCGLVTDSIISPFRLQVEGSSPLS